MGLFSSIFGGGEGKSSSSSQSGWALLPKSIQDAYSNLATESQGFLPSRGGAEAFKPMPLNTGEQSALSRIYSGFAPTSASLSSDMAMLQNPFDQYVIGGINREAQGQGSILNKMLNSVGQFGSNRAMLGANDIEQQRLNQIGTFQQSQFNNNLDSILNRIMPQRQQDAFGALQAGTYERGLDTQNKQAGLEALKAIAQVIGILPQSGGSTSTSSSSQSSGNGIMGALGGAASMLGGAGGLFGGGGSGGMSFPGGTGISDVKYSDIKWN